jgi:restriction system protein
MPVPDYQTMMRPTLAALEDGSDHSAAEVRAVLANTFGVSADELAERLPSGQPVFNSRAHWAATYMAQAGLVTRPRRGHLRITERGRRVLAEQPSRIDNAVLMQFPEFQDFKVRSRQPLGERNNESPGLPPSAAVDQAQSARAETPAERVRDAVREAETALASDLLERVKTQSPEFLERLVLDLLTAMGYGGREGAAQHLARSGDEGIDGVIRQDALGLDRVYVQANDMGIHLSGDPISMLSWVRFAAPGPAAEFSSPQAALPVTPSITPTA